MLPNFLPTTSARTVEDNCLVPTGTDGEECGCTLVAQAVSNQEHSPASGGQKGDEQRHVQKQRNPLILQRVASVGISSH
jgi:hypothetical protein